MALFEWLPRIYLASTAPTIRSDDALVSKCCIVLYPGVGLGCVCLAFAIPRSKGGEHWFGLAFGYVALQFFSNVNVGPDDERGNENDTFFSHT